MSDRAADAVRLRERVASHPNDRVSWHNLAAAEGDLGRIAQAESAARRAIALGITAPETRLVLARALQGQRRLDEAERTFAEAIALRPAYVEAHRDLAQLVWMRTGDVRLALRHVDRALRVAPREAGLHLVRSIVLEFAGDLRAGLAAAQAGLARAPDDSALLRQAAHLHAETGDASQAVSAAQRAMRLSADGLAEKISLCEALLAAGRLQEADAVARALCAARPTNAGMLALQATAWRLLGDPRYAALHDYDALVDSQRLAVPRGWSTLDDFLRDVAAELEGLHSFHTHPLQQSVRGGGQLPLSPVDIARPALAGLFQSIGAAVQRYVDNLGRGTDPFRSRNMGRFAISGAWSVRLGSGGYHTDHIHPHGWLSSACYIAVPTEVTQGGNADSHRAGWLRLGRPGVVTAPPLAAEHFVKPQPGLLVLFPAYMWHGVEPFRSATPRISVAFDVIDV